MFGCGRIENKRILAQIHKKSAKKVENQEVQQDLNNQAHLHALPLMGKSATVYSRPNQL
jgi:hypothetical protein